MRKRKRDAMVRKTALTVVVLVCFCQIGAAANTNGVTATNRTSSSAPPAPPIASALSSDVEALIGILQNKYVDPAQVADPEMNIAAVQGIVAALGHGAEIVTSNSPPVVSSNAPVLVRSETVAPLIGYTWLRTLEPAATKQLDEALKKLDQEKIDSLVLDLRFTKGGAFTDAVELTSKFLLKDKTLFTLQTAQPSQATSYTSTQSSAYIDWKVAVLVNTETEGAAEAAAAALRDQGRAVIIGSNSAGKAVVWSEETLPSGAKVRIATAKVVLASGANLFPRGIVPDVPIDAKVDSERKLLFELSQGRQMRLFVEEAQSEKRLNEAALVKMLGKSTNQPPETTQEPPKKDDAAKAEKKPASPIDTTLQRAVDILKGIRILHLD